MRPKNVEWDESLHRIIHDHDFIHPEGWFALSGASFLVAKRDFVFHGGTWRGAETDSLVKRLRGTPKRSVLVTHSDYHTNALHSLFLRALGAVKVWGTNVDPVRRIASPVPLGLTSPEANIPIHDLLSDRSPIAEAFEVAERPRELTRDFYVNVKAENHPSRTRFLEEVSDIPGVVVKEPSHTPQGRSDYCKSLREFPFVLAPRGNGVDTHRIWETLYLGGIPVVLQDKAIVPLVEGLPVVLLQRWSDLADERRVEEELDRIRHARWEATRLRMSWWLTTLTESHLSLARNAGVSH